MKKVVKKLTLSKETIVSLETGKLAAVAGAGVSDNWQNTTCMAQV